jgi:pyruvate-ferredoxin/flavodoxin oxidoreductase
VRGHVQEAQDLACIAHMATLTSRVPFVHFFDGFRTSHEVAKIDLLDDDDLRALLDPERSPPIAAARLTPDRPVLRGSAQNPDVFFQAREASNGFHDAARRSWSTAMRAFAARTGGATGRSSTTAHPAAERVIVVMGSGGETVRTRGRPPGRANGREGRHGRAGAALPAVRERRGSSRAAEERARDRRARSHQGTGRAGRAAVPRRDGRAAEREQAGARGRRRRAWSAAATGSRARSSRRRWCWRCSPNRDPAARHGFTIGIVDDVTHRSLPDRRRLRTAARTGRTEAVFFGLGADGTVGANKNTIKILGEATRPSTRRATSSTTARSRAR